MKVVRASSLKIACTALDETGATIDLTTADITCLLKKRSSDIDTIAIVSKTIFNGGVVITSPITGLFSVYFDYTDLDVPYSALFYEVVIKIGTTVIRNGVNKLEIIDNLIMTV